MPSLFISYRRSDSPDTVKLIYERLKRRLPRWEIFYDHESIPLGDEFPERLRTKVTSATVVLVIIGPKWLKILHERKTAAVDHVCEEVRLALQSAESVVPVLVGNAVMPADADLADFEDLQPLLVRNGCPVRPDPDFDGDLEPLIAHIKQFDSEEAIGATLADKYTLTAEVGHGGMGIVYRAEQKHPVKRTVAVKLIKPGMDSREVLARFDAERQALAVMDHPHIAKVLDAGMTAQGRPFFVMEFVKGVPITEYCDQKKLSPQERLNLFIPVCNAVQHAHQKGIIHRDIKPSNVLVEVIDGKPVPKVIDFGLAKALGHKLTDKTLYTAVNKFVGTLEYAAPEQAAGQSFEVNARADIYSLGVLLYELLTGAPPFSRQQLLKIGEEEMRRVIREVAPAKPSKKLSSSGELPAIAANRHLEPNKLTRLVQGDLDWIVMKCLEKEQGRRYETANQLGQELQRFLANEPVLAGPPSVGYHLKKFFYRRRGWIVGATALVVFQALLASVLFFVIAPGPNSTQPPRGGAVVESLPRREAGVDKIDAKAGNRENMPLLQEDRTSLQSKGYALLIGVKTFDHPALGELRFTENDVEDLAKLLDRPGSPFRGRVRVLTSTRGRKNAADTPTAENIRAALRELTGKRTREETVLVALASHGLELVVAPPGAKTSGRSSRLEGDSSAEDRIYPFFCPSDARLEGTDYATGYNEHLINLNDLILDNLGKCGAGSKLLLVDAVRQRSTRSLQVRLGVVPEGVAVMFGCKSGGLVYENARLQHGVFSYFVLKGLQGEAADRASGKVSWQRLVQYVSEEMESRSKDYTGGGTQTPWSMMNLGSDPVLFRLPQSSLDKSTQP